MGEGRFEGDIEVPTAFQQMSDVHRRTQESFQSKGREQEENHNPAKVLAGREQDCC